MPTTKPTCRHSLRVIPAVNGDGRHIDVVMRFGNSSTDPAGIVEVLTPSGAVLSAEGVDATS
jgi:hypothetical protein